jgi:catecholate siderophore receptor
MSIRSRKHAVARPTSSCADARALGLMLAALPGLALAGEAEQGERVLGAVVVTEEVEEGYAAERLSSPKFTQPLVDTPQTVVVITKELLDDQALGSLSEALRNTPGITFTLGENGNTMAGDAVTMRGFDVSGSIFVDGVRDLGAVSRDTFNTEQIEIVKGSSGSDIGRAAPTGYINLSSKQPTLLDAVSSTVAFGTDNRLRVEGDLNQTLGGWDGAAARLNVMYDRTDIPGRDVSDKSRWGFAPSLALGLDGDTRAYFNYLFVKQINTPDGGLPPIGLDGYNYVSAIAAPTGATQQQIDNVAALNTAITAAVATAPAVDRSNYYGSVNDFEHVRSNQFTVRLEHDLSDSTTLRNTSRYGRQSMRRLITGVNTLGNLFTGAAASGTATVTTPDVWTLSRARQRRDEVNEVLTNQTNVTAAFATGPVAHSLSTGVEFIYERQQNLQMSNPGTNVVANLYNPSTADAFLIPAPNGGVNDGNTLTAAVYLFDTVQLGEQFSVTAGLRFDRYRTEYSSVPPPPVPPVTTPGASVYAEAEGDLISGKLGLVYKPLENGSIYTVVATSQLPPGGSSTTLNNGANNMFVVGTPTTNNLNNPNLDPQKARNIEIGTKWELMDRRLIVTAAAFHTSNKNDLTQQDTVTLEVTQFGERRVRGFELGAAGLITSNWQVSAGFASMNTKITEGTTANQGAQFQFAPETTFTSWTTYTFPFGLQVGGGARYTASSFRNANANQATVTNLATNPSVWLVDAMASYEINDKVSLQLNAYNLTDELYFTSVNSGGSRFILGSPRTVLLSGSVQFY